MIIACPACNTRYVVPDSAIGGDGRTVRCAKCKHSWFQDGPAEAQEMPPTRPSAPPAHNQAPTSAPEPAPEPAREPDPHPAPDEETDRSGAEQVAPSLPQQGSGDRYSQTPPASEGAPAGHFAQGDDADESPAPPPVETEPEPPYAEVPADPAVAPQEAGEWEDQAESQFGYQPPFGSPRNRLKLWTWAAAIFAVLAALALGAASYFGLPEWVPIARPLFGQAEPDLKISFPVEQQDRRTLPNGTEFFGARIIVSNTATETRKVPPLLIVLRDSRERKVYSWEVVPQQKALAPGETMTINEAITDIPRSAVFADIGWAPG